MKIKAEPQVLADYFKMEERCVVGQLNKLSHSSSVERDLVNVTGAADPYRRRLKMPATLPQKQEAYQAA